MSPRSQLAVSGGLGVAGAVLLTGGALFLLQRPSFQPLIGGLAIWGLLAFLLFFSLVEIPMMIWGMRRMAGSRVGRRLANLTAAAFTFFAAVYAFPFLVLTGRSGVGLALAGLCLVRWAGAVWLAPGRQMRAQEQGSSGAKKPGSRWDN